MGPIGQGLDVLMKAGCCLLAVSVPLAIWKLIDVGWWLWSNLHWGAP
jgi:hypothetical protein